MSEKHNQKGVPAKKDLLHSDDEDEKDTDTLDVNQRDEDNDDYNTLYIRRLNETSVQFASAHVDTLDTFNMTDRPASITAESTYARNGSYVSAFENKTGKIIPEARVYAEAGVGRVRAEFSELGAEAKGPNAGVEAEVSLTRVRAMARAEVGSLSSNVGRLGVKAGLGFDTGASVGDNVLEVKVLGTGFSVGSKTSISVLGSEVSCSVM